MSAETIKHSEQTQPTIQHFVSETVNRFSRKKFHEESTRPYLLSDAIRDAIQESGRQPTEIVGALMRETQIPPSRAGGWEIILTTDYEGTWDDFSIEVSQSILFFEIANRNPDLFDENLLRDEEYAQRNSQS